MGDTDDVSLTGASSSIVFVTSRRKTALPGRMRDLALEFDRGETVRCYDCWLMLVQTGGDLRVGAFEYD